LLSGDDGYENNPARVGLYVQLKIPLSPLLNRLPPLAPSISLARGGEFEACTLMGILNFLRLPGVYKLFLDAASLSS
jgi:hypothetical protein